MNNDRTDLTTSAERRQVKKELVVAIRFVRGELLFLTALLTITIAIGLTLVF